MTDVASLYVTETFAMGMVTAALLAGLVIGWAVERYFEPWLTRWLR